MGHYASEMQGGELDAEGRASLDRFRLTCERDAALREARVVGMTAAIEHLVRNSPIPVEMEYVRRHLGLDDRGPEADAVSKAIMRLLTRNQDPITVTGSHRLVFPSRKARQP
jgi:hypothetical protein